MKRSRRSAFTLVELLVALALTLFIMVIMSECFVIAVDLFSGLKGVGDMLANVQVGRSTLIYDLSQDHYEAKRRPSDPLILATRPREGFIRVLGSPAVAEGSDGFGFPSARATDALHLTVKLKGNRRESFFSAIITDPNLAGDFIGAKQTFYNLTPLEAGDATLRDQSGVSFNSQWAEVAYVLVRTGSTEEPLNPASSLGTPLYGLYRCQYLVITDDTKVDSQYAVGSAGFFAGFACGPDAAGTNIDFYTPNDLANGKQTFVSAVPAAAPPTGAALLVPNVLSFQVQVFAPNASAPAGVNNTSQFVSVPDLGQGNVYDSRTSNYSVQGVQIILRVWDGKSRQALQTTIIQDL